MKEKKNKDSVEVMENALFIQRVFAFLFDVFIVDFASSLVTMPFIDSESISKLNESNMEVVDKYISGEVESDVYFSEVMGNSYQLAKKNGLYSLVVVFFEILYFIVYQFYNNGQTLGKKLMKIRIVPTDGDITMNQMIFRSFIINSVLLDMVLIGFIIFAKQSVYLYGVLIFDVIQYAIFLVSCFMVMFSNSGQGLHDRIAHTRVVRTNVVKELEVCEN